MSDTVVVHDEPKILTRDDLVLGLRELASYIEARPDLPLDLNEGYASLYKWVSPDDLRKAARAMGKAQKQFKGDWFELERSFGNGTVTLAFWTGRAAVCERRVIGTKEVEVEKPDPDAPKIKVKETVEEVEWVCTDPLLATKPTEV